MFHKNIKRESSYKRLQMERLMKGMTLEAVAQAVKGTYTGPEERKESELSSITIDSRQVEKDGLFVAIKGARVDGNTFIPGAYDDGALCCMSTEPPKDETKPYIQVESCEQALKDMAELYRAGLTIPVIGITGSVGKTTTKEMIAAVLSQKYDTLKTLGNFNNEIGLPLTIFRIREHHQAAVLEMGISDFGEMTRLAKVAKPDICVITNIGQCHLENLGTRDGILKAKTEIFTYLKPEGKAVLNGNDDKLCTLDQDERISAPVFYGLPDGGKLDQTKEGAKLSVYAQNCESLGLAGSRFMLHTPKGEISVTVPAPGRHMISNALAAAAVGCELGLSLEQIKAGIESYEPVGGHGHIIQADDMTIMDDCYNANPVSMKAGIDVLSEVEGSRTVAILGDMFELGDEEAQMHYEVGQYAARKGISLIISIGSLAQNYEKGLEEISRTGGYAGRHLYFADLDAFLETGIREIRKGDAVLVKASHAMHFEKIVKVLQEQ